MASTPSALFSDPSRQLLCVVGSCVGDDRDAQIAVTIFGVSIVPEKPRLVVVLWHGNHTRDLVAASRALTLSVLSQGNLAIVEPLGVASRTTDAKPLDGLPLGSTGGGMPYVEDSVGYAECRVLSALELGDATAFVAAPEREQLLSSDPPITWDRAAELLGPEFQDRYQPKLDADQRKASQAMLWL